MDSCGSGVSVMSSLVMAACDTEMCPVELGVSERGRESLLVFDSQYSSQV